ncbi:MAG: hypothetical protein ABI873_11370 [Marmoricola sp.]
MPVSRRRARSWRITAAVGVLTVATLVVAGALVTGDVVIVGGAGGVALAGGWVALRLAWSGIVQSRFEHAVDRAELTRAYRSLFAERAVEHEMFVADMFTRLAHRDRTIRELEGSLVGVEMRAVEAETSLVTLRRRLTDAEDQIASMEHLVATWESSRPPLLGPPVRESLRHGVVPEWADMETDAVTALVAWEEHASHVAGRHSADARGALDAWTARRA